MLLLYYVAMHINETFPLRNAMSGCFCSQLIFSRLNPTVCRRQQRPRPCKADRYAKAKFQARLTLQASSIIIMIEGQREHKIILYI